MPQPRKVGLFLATMLVAGNIVGSGLFLLPASLAVYGSMTTVGWLIAAAGALLVARVFGLLGAYAPERGGACAYAARALGPAMGFQATALYWMSCWIGDIALALAAIGYLASLVRPLAAPYALAWAAVGLIWLLTFANLLGPRWICKLEFAAMLVGLVPIALVLVAGWRGFRLDLFLRSWNVSGQPAWRAFPQSLVLMFWAFLGIESASIATAVVENPERNVARATWYGVLIAAVVSLSACGVVMGLIPAPALARSTAPFADAAGLLLGPVAAILVAVTACVKTVGSLGGWLLITAETGQSGAEHGLFPALFARAGRRGAPVWNYLIVAVLMSLGVFASVSPTLGEQFGRLVSVSVILSLLLYVFAALALWQYADPARPQPPGLPAPRRTRAIAFAGLLFSLAIIVLSPSDILALAAIIVFLTYALYPFCRPRLTDAAAPGRPAP